MSQKIILAQVFTYRTSRSEDDAKIAETLELIRTLKSSGYEVVRVVQQKTLPDSHTYIGSGKLEEIFQMVREGIANTVILNEILTPTVRQHVIDKLWKANPNVTVLDRVGLILEIFQKHARTSIAKLQVRLAKLRNMGPRIYGLASELGRQGGGGGGGSGNRGSGQTNLEVMRVHYKQEIKKIETEIKSGIEQLQSKIDNRGSRGFKTAAIVGYTNAGKSTLYNALTGKNKLSADKLFATLDSNVGALRVLEYNPQIPKILVTDTIGFIADLPASLIEAFRSTLLETVNADLIIHVVDASDPQIAKKIQVVTDTLCELRVGDTKQITVFNKIDKPPQAPVTEVATLARAHSALLLSAADGGGVKELILKIQGVLKD